MKEIELEEKQREEISYLPFPKGKIPCEVEFDYQGQSFLLVFFYNEAYDFFTADLYRLENMEKKPVKLGEKIVLNQRLFEIETELDRSLPVIVPAAFFEERKAANWESMGNGVELVVIE